MAVSRREVKDRSTRPFVQIDAELIKGLTNSEFKIYAQIKRRAGIDGECWESLPHMAAETGTSVSGLRDAVKGLIRKGLIKKIVRPGNTDLYELTPPSEWNLTIQKGFGNRGVRENHAPTHVNFTHLPTLNSPAYPREIHAPTHVNFTHDLDPIELDPINTPLYPPEGGSGFSKPAKLGRKTKKRKTVAELMLECPEQGRFEKLWVDYSSHCKKTKAQPGDKAAALESWIEAFGAGVDLQLITRGAEAFFTQTVKGGGVPHLCRFIAGAPLNSHPTPYWQTALEFEGITEPTQQIDGWEADPHRNPKGSQLRELGLRAGYVVTFEQSNSEEWLVVSQDYLGKVKKQAFTAEVVEKSLQFCQGIIERNTTWHKERNREVLNENPDGYYVPEVQPGDWISTGNSIRQVVQIARRGQYTVAVFADRKFEALEDLLPLKDCPHYPELQQELSHVA